MKLSEYLKIGTKMKILRKEKGISQKEMAEILGMIPSAYSNYENHFTDIPVEIMKKFCNIVGCSMNELIGFDVSTSEEVHPIFSISDLMLVIMDLNKKKLPVSVTFRSEGEKMNVDFQVAQTEYDEKISKLTERLTIAKEADWLYKKFGDGEYHDILGLCKVAYTTDDAKCDDKDGISIEEKGWSLTPGAFVGVAPVEDDGVNFEERMAEIHRELLALQAESNDLMDTISRNMKEMGI